MSTAVVIVTRNNPQLLEHAVTEYLHNDPGLDVTYYLVDNDSDELPPKFVSRQADRLNGKCLYLPNDRVEVSFSKMGTWLNEKHSHIFFAHDDCVPHKAGWLAIFHERMNSSYVEPEAPKEFANLPIGRVGAMHHYWRTYDNVKGFPVQCQFLKKTYELAYGEPPRAFKYADVDRVLISSECLKKCQIIHTSMVATLNAYNPLIETVLDMTLPYYDTGTYPADKYPAGQYWSRYTLLAEFLNSLLPLARGYRTVGLQGDGYLEQIHGDDVPFGHDYIAHYGAPNALRALAKEFKTTPEEIKKLMNNSVFLIRAHRFFKDYYK